MKLQDGVPLVLVLFLLASNNVVQGQSGWSGLVVMGSTYRGIFERVVDNAAKGYDGFLGLLGGSSSAWSSNLANRNGNLMGLSRIGTVGPSADFADSSYDSNDQDIEVVKSLLEINGENLPPLTQNYRLQPRQGGQGGSLSCFPGVFVNTTEKPLFECRSFLVTGNQFQNNFGELCTDCAAGNSACLARCCNSIPSVCSIIGIYLKAISYSSNQQMI